MRRRLLIAALGVSVLAHAAILGSTPGFGPADEHVGRPPPLDATLVTVIPEPVSVPVPAPRPEPAPQPLAKPKLKPKPKARVVAAPPDTGRAAEVAVPPPQEPTPPDAPGPEELALAGPSAIEDLFPPPAAPTPVAEPAAEPVAAASDTRKFDLAGWPRRGDIRFRVMLGDRGLQVGEARHEWSHDGKHYRMTTSLETTGVMDLLRNLRYRQHSEGRVGAKGLLPDRFGVEQSGKKPETAEFDWKAGQVTMRRGERTRVAPVKHGDQDLLSLWHQIGIVGASGLPHELNVVSGKSATPSILEEVGFERLSLPIGELDALRVRARALDGKLSIDIWLARSYGMLPVRIRIVDDKGEVLDQQAVELRLTPPGKARAESGVDAEPFVESRPAGEPLAGNAVAGDAAAQHATAEDASAPEIDGPVEPGEPEADAGAEAEMIELREEQQVPAFIYQ